MNNRKSGLTGETFACAYLEDHGYRILERNYRCKLGELDIVAQDGSTLVFVEVKARDTETFGQPFEAVTGAKIKKIIASARYWAVTHGAYEREMRFDVISVLRGKIEHIRDAFNVN